MLLQIHMKLIDCLNENIIIPPNIPDSLNFWHGGNLDNYNDIIAQKNGRYEYGPGLYLTTHYNTALKYSKGSRKLYLVTVKNGVDINTVSLDINIVMEFIKTYITKSKRKEVIERISKFTNNRQIKAYIFNNIILNNNVIKPSYTQHLRQFLVDNNIDYDIVNNPYGWGEKMMVLYNMKKIVNYIVIKPNDKIENYDLSIQ
jgi:hypothetical protein